MESTRSPQNSTVSWRRSASAGGGAAGAATAWGRGCAGQAPGSGVRWQVRTTRPDQDTAVLIHRQALAVDELVLEGLEVLVIELEVQLEGPIGQASTPL